MQTVGRVWMTTGAGRGLGAKIAGGMLECGDVVVATARNPQVIVDEFGSRDGGQRQL